MPDTNNGHVGCVAMALAKPGPEKQICRTFEGLAPLAHAEERNLRYELHCDLNEPRRYIIIEEWRDRSSFDAHCVVPHIRRYGDEAANWVVSSRSTSSAYGQV